MARRASGPALPTLKYFRHFILVGTPTYTTTLSRLAARVIPV
jgi:hypothetical protein